jgi:DNA-binding response OmpR family regulator
MLLKGARLLVVEDDPLVGFLISETLQEHGAAVMGPCTSASAALGLIQASPPSAALLDVNLTDGLSYPVAMALEDAGIPYAFISSSDPAMVPGSLHPFAFLKKPVSMAAIRALAGSLTLAGP